VARDCSPVERARWVSGCQQLRKEDGDSWSETLKEEVALSIGITQWGGDRLYSIAQRGGLNCRIQ